MNIRFHSTRKLNFGLRKQRVVFRKDRPNIMKFSIFEAMCVYNVHAKVYIEIYNKFYLLCNWKFVW